MTEKKLSRWMVFNIGCIECGVSSNVVGFYDDLEEANRIVDILNDELSWRKDGQNIFEVFDVFLPQHEEYKAAIAKATGAK